jgi:hypothetical protein
MFRSFTHKERSRLRILAPSRCIQSTVFSFVVILSTLISKLRLLGNLPDLCLHL